MANLTKEQVNKFTWIGCIVLLVIWLIFPSVSITVMGMSDSSSIFGLRGSGALTTIFMLLLFLCPLYLLLYCFKDKMPALKPIFVLDRKLSGIVLAAVAVLFIIILFIVKLDVGFGIKVPMSPAFGAWLYLIVAACICYLGMEEKK